MTRERPGKRPERSAESQPEVDQPMTDEELEKWWNELLELEDKLPIMIIGESDEGTTLEGSEARDPDASVLQGRAKATGSVDRKPRTR